MNETMQLSALSHTAASFRSFWTPVVSETMQSAEKHYIEPRSVLLVEMPVPSPLVEIS